MGLMKEFLMEKVSEYCLLNGLDEAEVYQDDKLYQQAVEYADKKLKEQVDGTKR
jgi:hypothetical protein